MYPYDDRLHSMLQRERHKDLIREAEQERMAHLAEPDGRAGRLRISIPPYCAALTWLGRRMVAWGTSLLERYGPAPSSYPALGVFTAEGGSGEGNLSGSTQGAC